MGQKVESRLDKLIDQLDAAYEQLFATGDAATARTRFRRLLQELRELLDTSLAEEERLDTLHVLADLAAELGDVAACTEAATELARRWQPADEAELEELLDTLVDAWHCFAAAELLLTRPFPALAATALAELREGLAELRQEEAAGPLTVEQNLALRTWLLEQGVLQEGEEGFELHEDEEQPLRHTLAWIARAGISEKRFRKFLTQQPEEPASDLEVLLGLEPPGIYDVFAYWPLEGTLRRFQEQAEDDENVHEDEEWSATSPDCSRMALFDDDEDAGYLFVYDRRDEELVAPPLWLFNRLPAPPGDEPCPGPSGGSPLVPAGCVIDPLPRQGEVDEVELLWSEDSSRVAVKIDGEFLGFVDVAAGRGYSRNLKQPTSVGEPWPEGLPWEEPADEEG